MARVSQFKSYREKEEETAKVTLKKFKNELRLYERCFDMCTETIDCIFDSTDNRLFDSNAKNMISIILPRIMQSMQSIMLLKTKGYYCDSMILERSLLESVGLCAYLSSDDEEAIRWLHGKRIKVASIHLFDHASKLLRIAAHDAEMNKAYGIASDYVHTNVRGAFTLVTPRMNEVKTVGGIDAGTVALQFTPQFDEKKVGDISVYPLLLTLVLEEIFKKELELNKKRQKKSERLFKLFVRTHKE